MLPHGSLTIPMSLSRLCNNWKRKRKRVWPVSCIEKVIPSRWILPLYTRTPDKTSQSKSEPSKAAFWWSCTSARGPANDPVSPLPICRAGGKANQQPCNLQPVKNGRPPSSNLTSLDHPILRTPSMLLNMSWHELFKGFACWSYIAWGSGAMMLGSLSFTMFHYHSHSSMINSPPHPQVQITAHHLQSHCQQCQVTAWWGKSVSLGRSIVTLSRLTWASASTPSLATCRAYLDSWPSSKFSACGIQFAAFLHSHSFCASRNSSISVLYSYAQMEKRTNKPPILSRQGAIHPENMLGARGKQTLQPVLQGLVGLSWTGSWGPNSHCDHFDLVAWWLIVHHCTWVFFIATLVVT